MYLLRLATFVGLLSLWAKPAQAQRPDLWSYASFGFKIDSASVSDMFDHFRSQAPNEGLVCLYGAAKDSTLLNNPGLFVGINEVTPAAVDSATPFRIYPSRRPLGGCDYRKGKLMGIAHSHPMVGSRRCSLSKFDMVWLLTDRRVLFSLVYCPDGWAEIIWRNGANDTFWWRAAERPKVQLEPPEGNPFEGASVDSHADKGLKAEFGKEK